MIVYIDSSINVPDFSGEIPIFPTFPEAEAYYGDMNLVETNECVSFEEITQQATKDRS